MSQVEFQKVAENFFAKFPEIILPEDSERRHRLALKQSEYKERWKSNRKDLARRMGIDPLYAPPEFRQMLDIQTPEYHAFQILEELFGKSKIDTQAYYQNFVEKHTLDEEIDGVARELCLNYLEVIAHYVRDGYVEIGGGRKKELPSA